MADKTMCTNFKYTPQVCLKVEEKEDMFSFFLINNTFDDIVINIPPDDISKLTLQNLQPSVKLPLNKKIGPQVNNEHLFDLKVVNKAASSTFNANPLFEINIGDPNAKSDGTLYALPFEKGKKFLCSQSFNGKSTHKDNFKHAVDFQMNIGTKVTAARSGIVAEVKQDSNKGGNDKKLINEGNFVRIRHDDGTFGFYGHLKQNGARVNVGQKVNEGDIIAESGNTGFTTGPHLHFDIRIADGKGSYNMTVDWKFKSVNGRKADIPKENEIVENK